MAREVYEYGYHGATLTERLDSLEERVESLQGSISSGEGPAAADALNSLPARGVFHVTTVLPGSSDFPLYVSVTPGGLASTELEQISERLRPTVDSGTSSLVWVPGSQEANQFLIPDIANIAGVDSFEISPVDGYMDSIQLRLNFGVEHTVDQAKWRRGWGCRFLVLEDYDTPNNLINPELDSTVSEPYHVRDVVREPGSDPSFCCGLSGRTVPYPQWTFDMLDAALKSPIRPPRDDTKPPPRFFLHNRSPMQQAGGLYAPAGSTTAGCSVYAAGLFGSFGNYGPNNADIPNVPAIHAEHAGAWHKPWPVDSVYEHIVERSSRRFKVLKDFMISIPPPPTECLQQTLVYANGTGSREFTVGVPPAEVTFETWGTYNAAGALVGPLAAQLEPAGGTDLFKRYTCDVTIPVRSYQRWSKGQPGDSTTILGEETQVLMTLNKRWRVIILPGPTRYMRSNTGATIDTWSVSALLAYPRQTKVNPDVRLNIFGECRFNTKKQQVGQQTAHPNQLIADSYAANDSIPGATFKEEFDYTRSGVSGAEKPQMRDPKRMRPSTS